MSGLDIPLEGKSIRQLCGTVLVFEAIVIALAIPVAIVLEHANHGLAGGVGGALAVCAVLIGGVVGRPRMAWALLAGTILQLLVIAAGVVVPAMYILGIIFAALWFTGIWLARRVTPAPTPPDPAPPRLPRAPYHQSRQLAGSADTPGKAGRTDARPMVDSRRPGPVVTSRPTCPPERFETQGLIAPERREP
jgi:hypothetical protein